MPTHTCPTCGKSFDYIRIAGHATYPFCCERCRMAELGGWLDERYVIERPLTEDDVDEAREAAGVGTPTDEDDGDEKAPS